VLLRPIRPACLPYLGLTVPPGDRESGLHAADPRETSLGLDASRVRQPAVRPSFARSADLREAYKNVGDKLAAVNWHYAGGAARATPGWQERAADVKRSGQVIALSNRLSDVWTQVGPVGSESLRKLRFSAGPGRRRA
jgi:hypothetical protein